MTRNRTPGRAGEREPGLGQGDQLQDSGAASVGQFTEPGTLPLDPRPDVGNVACIICGRGPTEYVAYYSAPEKPGITTKYGLCSKCANTPVPVEDAARITEAMCRDLAASTELFSLLCNLVRCES